MGLQVSVASSTRLRKDQDMLLSPHRTWATQSKQEMAKLNVDRPVSRRVRSRKGNVNIVLDRTDFEHGVDEVELEREISVDPNDEVPMERKRSALAEMHGKIDAVRKVFKIIPCG
uniref:Uncharacterized protein n=1 Tax=Coccidioides posadasii RMSCC 3488 TaxID=454284 RepID=A0A0J6FQ83_COCPO|nr:hypothetical protein CPAG_07913 [Coccidioides posadasii RMSCC 3488]